jgi:hypothetical protein
MNPIKIIGNLHQLSGIGTTVADVNNLGAQYVLVQHIGAGNHYITQQTGAGVTIGSIYIPSNSNLLIKKERTDEIKVDSGNDVYATSVVYQG